MQRLLLICIATIVVTFSYTQTQKSFPEALLAEAKTYEDLSLQTLNKASLLLREGNGFIDSAKVVSRIIQSDLNNPEAGKLISTLESYYLAAYSFIAKADSLAIIAENYKNISLEKTKEAFGLMGMDVAIEKQTTASPFTEVVSITEKINDSKPIISTTAKDLQSNFPASSGTYIIQMGAGNMRMDYFNKIPDIVVVNCRDGVKRFVIDGVFTKQEAEKKRVELEKMGYEQIFIRTKESLDKIRL